MGTMIGRAGRVWRSTLLGLLLMAVTTVCAPEAGSVTLPAPAGPLDVTGGGTGTGGEWALAALRTLPVAETPAAAPSAVADIPLLSVPYYSQRDPRWGCQQLGNCACDRATCTTSSLTTIADAGCYPTCQAMIFAYYNGGQYADPSAYNACLIANQGYEAFPGACATGQCGALDNPPLACRPEGLTYVGPSLDKALLDEDLANGYPAIGVVDVNVPGRLPHAVVIVGKRNGRYVVNDPYYNRSDMAPESIYGFHRWRGPVPGGARTLPEAAAAVTMLAAPAGPQEEAPAEVSAVPAAKPAATPLVAARFRSDVTIPDGARMGAGSAFVKTWELANTGTVAWPEGTRLVHVSGPLLGPAESVAAPRAGVGEAAQVSVEMVTPEEPGRYISRWRLRAPDGAWFGPTIWVDIRAVR